VKAGDQTIAVLYNLIHGARVMNYQSGFLYETDNRLAPGFVAHAIAAQHYSSARFNTYDLLAGDADYKQRLGKQETTLTSLVLERPTWRNRLRRLVRR
jgi:CelD/BcsL family acetyltransferase involved in cellulose biosynthesis